MFQTITLQSGLVWIGLLAALMIINELLRMSKWFSILFFIVIPVVFSFAIWPAAQEGSLTDDWFHWAKLYSVIAAGIGFTVMRFTKLGDNRIMKFFPVLILAINILEAVLRDFEVAGGTVTEMIMVNGVVTEGPVITGGIHNIMNGIAGILSIITLCGWSGIFIDRKDKSDMVWADMTVFWVIAYDLWNWSYIYNCIPSSAFFGLGVLLACTIPSIFIKKGTWIQARSFTLSAWMMLMFTFPLFFQSEANVTLPSEGTFWKVVLAGTSLLFNVAFFVYHYRKVIVNKTWGWGQEVHTDTKNSKIVHAMADKA